MIDREKIANGLRHCLHYKGSCFDCPYDGPNCQNDVLDDAIALLKEHEVLKQKMWNALYAEEDKLEKKFRGTEELHDYWFSVYRPWLQRGFEIAVKVIAEQDGM